MPEEIEDIAGKRWTGLLKKIRDKAKEGVTIEKEWKTKKEFVKWFRGKYEKRNGKCFYFGLEGDVKKNYKSQLKKINKTYFRDRENETDGNRTGGRGQSLELERKESKDPYSKKNCVLACYPCNNAKSDVFAAEEFEVIGAVIGALKRNGLEEFKSTKFIQGLINEVKKTTGREI